MYIIKVGKKKTFFKKKIWGSRRQARKLALAAGLPFFVLLSLDTYGVM